MEPLSQDVEAAIAATQILPHPMLPHQAVLAGSVELESPDADPTQMQLHRPDVEVDRSPPTSPKQPIALAQAWFLGGRHPVRLTRASLPDAAP